MAVKNVTGTEESVDHYFPGMTVYPPSLIVEGLAQTGGLLVAEVNDFKEHVVLAKISNAKFHHLARAGDTLKFTTEILDVKAGGATMQGSCHIGDKLQAEVSLLFAHLDDRFDKELWVAADFLRFLRILRIFEVGRTQQGDPLNPPEWLLKSEAADEATR